MNIMTPKHSQWKEFCELLEGPEGCDFQKNVKGKITWKCMGGYDKSKAKAILKKMRFDVDSSLSFFDKHGGHCDCEILFNINA